MAESIKYVSNPSNVIPTLLKSVHKRVYLAVFDSNYVLVAYGPTQIEEVYPDQDDYSVKLNHVIIRLRPFTINNYVAIEVKNGIATLLSLHPITSDLIESKPVEIHIVNKNGGDVAIVPVLSHYNKKVVYSKVWEPNVKNHIRKEVFLRVEEDIRENGHHQAHREFIEKFKKHNHKKIKIGEWEGNEFVTFYTCDNDGEIKYHLQMLTMNPNNQGEIRINDKEYNVSRAIMRGSGGYTYWFWKKDSDKHCNQWNMLHDFTILCDDITLKELREYQRVINQKLELERFERNKILLKNTSDESAAAYEMDTKCAKETEQVYKTFLKNNYD